ncbi:PREDICTED: NAD(P)H-quinone oxidoreductase [Prunus dulcis]|uniref:PREDICTED: NAD(P)H-quinone oxidoreductase n=1 Tax=Prunus dulcis TaxID=3755 RepID=A0A5E4GGX4_PRUDU|nr:PREDICTED: NAD(P)H-quinone oxidoreductase [Prunus dulcis]
MASSATTLSQNPFSSFSRFPQTLRRNPLHLLSIKAVKAAEPDKTEKLKQTKTQESTNATQPSTTTVSKPPKKPVYSMKKGQIVRVEKEKYLNSVNYLSVGHPPYYKGLDYIYEDRGEVLDLRIFETGEYALVAWVGVPTAPAWLPTEMLIKGAGLIVVSLISWALVLSFSFSSVHQHLWWLPWYGGFSEFALAIVPTVSKSTTIMVQAASLESAIIVEVVFLTPPSAISSLTLGEDDRYPEISRGWLFT